MSQSKSNIIQTLNDIHQDGNLSQSSLTAINNIPDIGAKIQNGLGIGVDEVNVSEVFLLGILGDDSQSFRTFNNEQNMRDGHNLFIDAMAESDVQDNIQVMTTLMNRGVLHPFTPIGDAIKLDTSNYSGSGFTPLRDRFMELLSTMITKTQQFEDNGIQVRSFTMLNTDGEDTGSRISSNEDIKNTIHDMLQSEKHIVAAMGFENDRCDFRPIFKEMGIPDQWVFTTKADKKGFQKAFGLASQSASRASQSAAAFSTTAMGGFGN